MKSFLSISCIGSLGRELGTRKEQQDPEIPAVGLGSLGKKKCLKKEEGLEVLVAYAEIGLIVESAVKGPRFFLVNNESVKSTEDFPGE